MKMSRKERRFWAEGILSGILLLTAAGCPLLWIRLTALGIFVLLTCLSAVVREKEGQHSPEEPPENTAEQEPVAETKLLPGAALWEEEKASLAAQLKQAVEQAEALAEQNLQLTRQNKMLEMNLLQAQINPHFLYNTLYCIQQLYDMGEKENASRMVSNLSSFFRMSLSKGREVVTVQDEVEHLQQYIAIQQMRYDHLTYDVCVSESLYDFGILKMTLQPLVENAIYHGVFRNRSGHIKIKGLLEGEDMVFTIIDNGRGMPPERLAQLTKAIESGDWTGLDAYGVRNVQERIRLACGEGYGLTYRSEEGRGTRVIVRVSRNLVVSQPG